MSDSYTLVSSPKRWASAHQPIRFLYDMPRRIGDVDDKDGYANVLLSQALAGGKAIVKGDLIYISSGVYKGYHVVKEVDNNLDFTLETNYISFASGVQIKYATPPVWQVWKGYQDSEITTNYHPFAKVAEFSPEGNADGLLEFNISGYVQAAMHPITPQEKGFVSGNVGVSYDWQLFMPYRLLIGITVRSLYFEDIYLALNSAINSDELNAEYLKTDKPLNSYPIINSCGTTFISFLGLTGVSTFRLDYGSSIPSTVFNNDFNNDFFKG